MPADTNRKTEIRTAPAPGNYRTAPITGRRKAAATGPTWIASGFGRRSPAFAYWNSLGTELLRATINLPLLQCGERGAESPAADGAGRNVAPGSAEQR